MKTFTKALFIILIWQWMAISVVYGQYQMPEQGLCAHRGAMTTHPENTIIAFQAAIYAGAHMMELDVQLTKDSVMVVMHDAKVDRTTNGSGRIADMLFEDIRKLYIIDANGKEHRSLKVPTFEEVLALMPKNIWINCHLKGENSYLAQRVARHIQEQGRVHQAFIACNKKSAQYAREIVPDILICNMESGDRKDHTTYVNNTVKQNANFLQFLSSAKEKVQPENTKALRKEGVKSNYFRATHTDQLEELFGRGIDFILVDDIIEFMPIAEKLGIKRLEPVF